MGQSNRDKNESKKLDRLIPHPTEFWDGSG